MNITILIKITFNPINLEIGAGVKIYINLVSSSNILTAQTSSVLILNMVKTYNYRRATSKAHMKTVPFSFNIFR